MESNCTILSTMELDGDGNAAVRPLAIPPPPLRGPCEVEVPLALARQIEADHVCLTYVVGDSMQSTILHNDMLIISLRKCPRNGAIVAVKTTSAHRVWPGTLTS